MKENILKELEDSILTRNDLKRIFKVSKVTIWKWVKKGILREHTMDTAIFYLKDEVLEDLRNAPPSIRKRPDRQKIS